MQKHRTSGVVVGGMVRVPVSDIALAAATLGDCGWAQLSLVFYAPEYGITTVMQVQGDLSGVRGPIQKVKFSTYKITSGSDLFAYCMFHVRIAPRPAACPVPVQPNPIQSGPVR
eukprot:4713567-Pyramimonas_sp.AAC.2